MCWDYQEKCGFHQQIRCFYQQVCMYVYIYVCVLNILYIIYIYYLSIYLSIYIYDAQWIDWMETTAGNVGVLPSNTGIVPWMFPETRFITPAGTRSFAMGANEWIPIYYTRDRRTNAINPALQPNSRFQGSKAAMLSGKVPRCYRVPRFHSCRFPVLQGC